jgi:hypothetical protein
MIPNLNRRFQFGMGDMKNTHIILGGVLVIALLFSVGTVAGLDDNSPGVLGTDNISDDIAPYNGPIGADNPLHGLKLAMEDLDETFTFNDTQRVEKRLDHAQLRIAEVREELDLNQTTTAERVLELYRQKLNLTEETIAPFGSNATGLLHAQEMLARHQAVLTNLVLLHPNNTGLARAYNNSVSLEQKFGEKTDIRFARVIEKNKTVFKAVKLETRNHDRARDGNVTVTGTMTLDRDTIREKIKDQKDMNLVNTTDTSQTGPGNDTPASMKNPQEDKGSSRDKGKNGRD